MTPEAFKQELEEFVRLYVKDEPPAEDVSVELEVFDPEYDEYPQGVIKVKTWYPNDEVWEVPVTRNSEHPLISASPDMDCYLELNGENFWRYLFCQAVYDKRLAKKEDL